VEEIELLDRFTKVTSAGDSPITKQGGSLPHVSGPLIAIALTLCVVFLPSAFISGIPGPFFAQFATTIATSTTSILLRGFIKPPSHPALRATLFSKAKEQHPYVLDLARMPGLGCFFWKEKTDNGER
jgi:HAE1 family hydrophobic/amphiphilic exporter-1